ncbi:MAG: hypothetical protein IKQ39_01540 [Oscillospiraceae bacterium]|nr:hypothetical protein [Oscillospiraceae bacterium]
MKKRFVMTMSAAVFAAAMSVPAIVASAAKIYQSPAVMVRDWDMTGYPSYVCGVWTETGETDELVIGIVPGEEGEQGKAEIRAMLEDPDSVTFAEQQFSHDTLYMIMKKMDAYVPEKKVPDAYGWGVYQKENCINVSCNLEAPSGELKEMMDYFAKYDGAVVFEQGEPVRLMTDGIEESESSEFVPDYDPDEYDGLPEWNSVAEDEYIWGAEIGADKDNTITIGAIDPNENDVGGTPGNEIGAVADGEVLTGAQPSAAFGGLESGLQSAKKPNAALWVCCGFGTALLLGGGLWLVHVKRREAAMQTNTGAVVQQGRLTLKQTEQTVREQTPELPDDLCERIRDRSGMKK